MKKTLLFKKQNFYTFCSLLLFCFCTNLGWSQQVIGEFPEMDGGLEAQTADNTMSSAGSSQSGTPSTIWTVSSTSNSLVREITDDATLARSGDFSSAWAVNVGSTNVRMQSPTPTSPTIQINTQYTVQFFYKASTDPGTDLDPGIYLNNTSGGNTTNKTDVTAFAADTWTKTYGTVTTGANFNASNWAVARISTTAAGGYNDTVRLDDFVVYAGTYDDVAPTAATDPTYTTGGNVGWTAPAGGVDGGGYVVFRYTSLPAADNDPNQNGIYQVGSTTTNGTGGLTGTVAYIGTGTSFTEPYVVGTYYKVYAVDKAFNYSDELIISDATLGVAQFQDLSGLSIFPNPTKSKLTIKSSKSDITGIEMYNILGTKVLTDNILNNDVVDVSNLSAGVYLLKVFSGNNSVTKRVIIE